MLYAVYQPNDLGRSVFFNPVGYSPGSIPAVGEVLDGHTVVFVGALVDAERECVERNASKAVLSFGDILAAASDIKPGQPPAASAQKPGV